MPQTRVKKLLTLTLIALLAACASDQEKQRKEDAELAQRAAQAEAQAKSAQQTADSAQRTADETQKAQEQAETSGGLAPAPSGDGANAAAGGQQNGSLAQLNPPASGAQPSQAAAPAAPPKCDCPPPPPPPPPQPPYKLGGEFSVGFQKTTGNSSTEALNAKLSVGWQWERWKDAFEAAGLESSENHVRAAQRYSVSDKLNHDVFENDFVFGQVEYDNDHFGAYRERLSETGGYGHHFLKTDTQTLDTDLGAGARQQTTNVQPGCVVTATSSCTQEHTTDFIGRADIKYEWKIQDKTTLGETAKYERGRLDTFEESITELKASVWGNLSSVISFTARHHTSAPPGAKKDDTMTSIGLTYAFGTKP